MVFTKLSRSQKSKARLHGAEAGCSPRAQPVCPKPSNVSGNRNTEEMPATLSGVRRALKVVKVLLEAA